VNVEVNVAPTEPCVPGWPFAVKNSFHAATFASLGTMVFGLVRRVFSLACLLLVAYAAATVPVGRRTAWGHLVAIFTAPPAREAAEDVERIAAEAWRKKAARTPASPGHTETPSKP
jgi:hypothetical protein